jgi:uncharacterized protein
MNLATKMSKTIYLCLGDDEAWLLPQDDGPVLFYAPLRSYLAVFDNEFLKVIDNLNQTGLSISQTDIGKQLKSILQEKPKTSIDEISYTNIGMVFLQDLSLAISNRCNLACVYCHSDAGIGDSVLPISVAKSAIRRLVSDCLSRGAKFARLQFAGGGEPTMHISIVLELISFLKELCRKEGLKHEVGMATNGAYSQQVAYDVAKNFSGVSLSHDGPKSIFDVHRPLRNGNSAFSSVMQTAKIFQEQNLPFALRATVSSLTIERKDEFFGFFENEFPGRTVGLEPLNPQGRGALLRENTLPPSPDEFADFLSEAYKKSLSSNFQFRNSMLGKFDLLRTHFCMSIAQPAMTVLPNCDVVACTRSNAPDLYRFGFIKIDGTINLDEESIVNLRNMNVMNAEQCNDCYCKYNCGGGCLDLRISGHLRCDVTRRVGEMILSRP